jgi:uncharacterized membrane protein
MMDGMGSMMAWMMGFGLLSWVLVIALLVTIVVLLFQLVSRTGQDRRSNRDGESPGKLQLR